MTSYHYLYRITNLVEQKHYYGIRTSKDTLPQQDLGIKYFSSSYDKEFLKDQKESPQNYRYKVIITSNSRERVVELEVKLHNKFNVSTNPKFYNKAKQTSTKFDATGYIYVKGGRWIYNIELQKNTIIDYNTPLPEGWTYGRRSSEGECLNILSKGTKWIHNIELQKNSRISYNMSLPEGWEYGRKSFEGSSHLGIKKGVKGIYNLELQKNKNINKDDPLPEGWAYGRKKFIDESLTPTIKKRWIFNTELNKKRKHNPNNPIPLGWEYGVMLKGNRWIYNLDLKQTKRLPPDEILPEGWSYGRKRF